MAVPSCSKFKLGVTGGIGSGKTTVCRVFSILGIPVFYADTEARIIMDSDENIIRGINSLTKRNLYPGGKLNRKELAGLIFNNEYLLKQVNSLVHPAVFEKFFRWEKEQKAPYLILEAAILFESGAAKLVDRTVTVVTPVQERIERVMQNNSLTEKQVTDRIRNQIDDEARIKLSDYVISNSERDMIIPSILVIHNEILKLIKKGR